MAYQLEARDSTQWLQKKNPPTKVGPGAYDIQTANVTKNSWNTAGQQINGYRGSSKLLGEDIKSENQKRQMIPFNSKIDRDEKEKLSQQFNPGPGSYGTKNSSFKYDFVTRDQINQRRIMSQEGGQRSTAPTAGTSNHIASLGGPSGNGLQSNSNISKGGQTLNGMFSQDTYGNPSYTIKDGGTLKKKLQPYAADTVQRDGLNIDKERLNQVTAPGSYTLPNTMGAKKGPPEHFKKKTAADRLRQMGMLNQYGNMIMDGRTTPDIDISKQESMTDTKDVIEEYTNGLEDDLPQSVINQKDLLKPSNADMMQRVRTTAKWSQLYKSGSSFPPKHKVLFINQDEEVNETRTNRIKPNTHDTNTLNETYNDPPTQDIKGLSPDTYRNQIQNDFDEVGRLIDANSPNYDGNNIKVHHKNNENDKKNIMLTLNKPNEVKQPRGSLDDKDTFRVSAIGESQDINDSRQQANLMQSQSSQPTQVVAGMNSLHAAQEISQSKQDMYHNDIDQIETQDPIDFDETGMDLTEIRIKKAPIKKKPEAPKINVDPLGPGQYDPTLDYVRKQAPSYNWGVSKVTRPAIIGDKNKENPGPGNYNQQQQSIGMKMMRGILQQETVLEDKHKGNQNHHKLVQKLSNKTKGDQAAKKERHILKKKFYASKVQPGAHQNIYKESDFAVQKKQDFLQFFGTTDAKINEDNFLNNKNSAVGPGTYNQYKGSFNTKTVRRANTASFNTKRNDLLFNGNNNPGPQEYQGQNTTKSFTAKNWSTNIGAFGSTEKKFSQINKENQSLPGPGSYRSSSFAAKKFTTKKIKGKNVKIRTSNQSSFFTSASTRTFDDNLEKNIKFHWPATGQYDQKGKEIGQEILQGGAPNNFLLLKSNKTAAPFKSTVPRFKNDVPKTLQNNLGPGQYSTNQNFDLSLDCKNNQEQLYPGQKRKQAFGQEERWKANSQKNFRIGEQHAKPSVGTYNPDTSAFTKTKSGYNYRFY